MRRKRWFVYMLECEGGTLYTGIAVDVRARFEAHVRGKGAKYTRARKPLRILASRRCADRSAALKAEAALKKLARPDKLAWARSPAQAVRPVRHREDA